MYVICIYVYMYVCIYVYMYVFIFLCMYLVCIMLEGIFNGVEAGQGQWLSIHFTIKKKTMVCRVEGSEGS